MRYFSGIFYQPVEEKEVFRRCAVTRKMLSRKDLFRIVRTPEGKVWFQKEGFLLGRGVHFAKNMEAFHKLFSGKTAGFLSHLLKVPLSSEDMNTLKKEVLSALENETQKNS